MHLGWNPFSSDRAAIRPVRARTPDGFTLVELLVVIAIIALLVAIVLPGVTGALDRGRAIRCLSNLRQVGLAQHQYSIDHYGMYTPTFGFNGNQRTWQEILAPYIATGDRTNPALVLSCPNRRPSPDGANQASYAMNVFITWPQWNFSAEGVPAPSRIILLGDCVESNSDIMFYADRDQTWGVPGFRHDAKTVANMLFCDQSARGMFYDDLILEAGHWRWW